MQYSPFAILLAVCSLSVSCGGGDRHPDDSPPEPLFEVGYTAGSRGGGGEAPANGSTYTMVSYRVSDLNNVPTATPYVAANENQRGYYVYLEEEGNPAFVETDFLVPSRMRNEADPATDYPYPAWNTPPVRNNTYGQKLQAGKYKTAVIHPAAMVLDCGILGYGQYLVVLPRDMDCPVYAPLPGGLIGMTVEKNLAVYDIGPTDKLYITLAQMNAYFYSSPDVEYTIRSVKLLNMGTSGWFNPYTEITYPNYGSDPLIYSQTDNQVIFDPAHWRVSTAKGGTENLGYVTHAENGVGGTWPVHYLMDQEAVFATDYRGQSENGTLYNDVKTIIMRITVGMPVPGTAEEQQITADIPVSLRFDRGKRYNFYFDVRSGIFSITYSITGWEQGNSDSGDLPIGETLDYGSYDFVGGGGWVFENQSDGVIDIGGANR